MGALVMGARRGLSHVFRAYQLPPPFRVCPPTGRDDPQTLPWPPPWLPEYPGLWPSSRVPLASRPHSGIARGLVQLSPPQWASQAGDMLRDSQAPPLSSVI